MAKRDVRRIGAEARTWYGRKIDRECPRYRLWSGTTRVAGAQRVSRRLGGIDSQRAARGTHGNAIDVCAFSISDGPGQIDICKEL